MRRPQRSRRALLRRGLLVALVALAGPLLLTAPADAVVAGAGVTPSADVPGFGDLRGSVLSSPVVGMAATPSGGGYWLVASDGGIFTFGDAGFHGSTGAIRLNQPIVGMAATPSGGGYWLVASDGGIFAFGDAGFHGSTGAIRLNQPIVGMAGHGSAGYWLAAADGGVFTFGDAPFFGSAARARVDRVVAIVASGPGYVITAADGDIASFGIAPLASLASTCKDQMLVGAAARAQGGQWTVSSPVPPAKPSADPLTGLANEQAQLETVLRFRQACQPTPGIGRGLVANPLPGARTTTVFGLRLHPIYQRVELHAGIDLAGPSRILAAAEGTVIEVGYRVGYGLTTVVDHGNGLATLYAHQALTSVRVGDHVQFGQGIGTVGSSGFATGPHLHFEVRVHGVPTDPRLWL